jgi:phenylacetate-CoA ligase
MSFNRMRRSVMDDYPVRLADLPWEVWRAPKRGAAAIAARQRDRLSALIAHARAHSPFYQSLYAGLPAAGVELPDLPVVSKPELMAHFDGWVTDPAVNLAGVRAFAADRSVIGRQYLGRYAVWSTSGTTGRPGIFLHERTAQALYQVLLLLRGWPSTLRAGGWARAARRGLREAFVVATGGHFASISVFERTRRRSPFMARSLLAISILRPLAEIVESLNQFQPALLAGYPSALVLLAREQASGRLAIDPVALAAGGETLDPLRQAEIEAAFGCPLHDMYGTSEFLYVGFACRHGWHHVNADWLIFEPVDDRYAPVAAGEPSHTVLLTNLANRIQPLIRYDLGDSVTLRPGPCPCGSPLPAIHVEGRRDDILRLAGPGGKSVAMLPLALATVIEEAPGVHRFQAIQTAPDTLRLRLEAWPGADAQAAWGAASRAVQDYLAAQGVGGVSLVRAPEPPQADPVSGKFRQVWAELQAASTSERAASGPRKEVPR